MSIYGDSDKGCNKNTLFDIIDNFIEKYGITEFVKVFSDVMDYRYNDKEE